MMTAQKRLGWASAVLVLAAIIVVLSAGFAGQQPAQATLSPVSFYTSGVGTAGAPGAGDVRAGDGDTARLFSIETAALGDFGGSPPRLTSPSAIVVNLSTGHVLHAHNAEQRRPMASTTKIMTAILCLDLLPLTQQVVISRRAAATSEVKPFLREGDVVTVEQLLYCLMVQSSNASAVALAEAADGDVETFVDRMNAKASLLGMHDTHFANPSGLDADGHHSTAYDLAVLGRYAMQNAQFRRLVAAEAYRITVPGRNKTYEFENTNKLMLRTDWVTGVKTGVTPRADQCLVAAGTRNGVSVLSVILGQPSTSVCWDESDALLQYGFSQYRHVRLFEAGMPVAEAEVPYRLDGRVRLVTQNGFATDLFRDDVLTADARILRDLTLPVQAGEFFGEIIVEVGGHTVGTVALVSDGTHEETTLGTKLAYFWGNFARLVERLV